MRISDWSSDVCSSDLLVFLIVAGSAYLHDEEYKGQANAHWRGVVVLNEVRDGQFCEMPLTLDYLCRKYEGMSLARFLQRNVRNAKSRLDRKSVVKGKRVSVRVNLGGRGNIKKKKNQQI